MSEEAAEIIPNPRGVATIKPRDLNTVMRVFAWFDWPITPKMQADSVAELDRQINSPTLKERVKARAILAMHKLQDQNMKERHHRENLEAQQGMMKLRMDRAEQGLPNDAVAVQVTIPPPTVAPLPAWAERFGMMTPNEG